MTKPEMNTNPKVKRFTFGILSLKTVNMYPLAMADQDEVLDGMLQAVNKACDGNLGNFDKMPEIAILVLLKKIVAQNLDVIAKKVFRKEDIPEKPSTDIDNDQFVQFVENLWEQNYEDSLKNGMGLFGKIKAVFQSERPSDSSPQTIPNTA